MKKIMPLLLCTLMLTALFAGCSGQEASPPPPAGAATTESALSGTASPANLSSGTAPAGARPEAGPVKRIAVVCDPVGVNPFLTQVVDKFAEVKASGAYPMEYSVMECTDNAAWAENIRASVEEGYDLIVAVGWMGADTLDEVASRFPDKAQYVCIDTVCDNPRVKSFIFRPQEAAYLVGVVAGGVSRDAGKAGGPYGAVHANPGPGSFEWRYGYMEGVKRVNPEVTNDAFLFNYTRSYTDAPAAKELALQQAAQGCVFINAASAVADFGTFEAALEKGFYTSGQDADRTSPDNPNIITTQVKYTGVVAGMVIDEFFATGIRPGVVKLGLADGAVGAIYITDDGVNPRNAAVLTDEILAEARKAKDDIISGRLDLTVPLEDDYFAAQ
ncbi:MAG: BMP family ABC transporter substrate-binding protein [Clostridiales bacterium]|nr:BMP family ABC transporter substrate-binding protein [Clostridiales bacterium]